MFDATKVREEAEAEVRLEEITAAKKRIKGALKALEAGRKVVRQLERELEVIMAEIGEGS